MDTRLKRAGMTKKRFIEIGKPEILRLRASGPSLRMTKGGGMGGESYYTVAKVPQLVYIVGFGPICG